MCMYPILLFHITVPINSWLLPYICLLLTQFLLLLIQPPRITLFINKVTSTAFENIEETLKDFVWEFDKVCLALFQCFLNSHSIFLISFYINFLQGDFHQWIDLFNHFDSFFDKYTKPRKDLQIEDNFLNADPLFPKDAVLQILHVMRVILENCTNKYFYSSFEVCVYLLMFFYND